MAKTWRGTGNPPDHSATSQKKGKAKNQGKGRKLATYKKQSAAASKPAKKSLPLSQRKTRSGSKKATSTLAKKKDEKEKTQNKAIRSEGIEKAMDKETAIETVQVVKEKTKKSQEIKKDSFSIKTRAASIEGKADNTGMTESDLEALEKSTVASKDMEMEKMSHCENESDVQEGIENAKV